MIVRLHPELSEAPDRGWVVVEQPGTPGLPFLMINQGTYEWYEMQHTMGGL